MSAKGKLIRNSIIAAIILALLAAAYIFAVKFEPSHNTDTDTGTYTDNAIKLFSTKSDSIKSVKICLPDVNYTLVQNSNGEVSISELNNINFVQSRLKSALLTFTSINAEREVLHSTNKLADFGLADKTSYFTITLTDGNEHTFYVGSAVPGGKGCYLKSSNSDKIYIMSEYFVNTISKSPNNYRDTELFTLDIQSVSAFSVAKGNSTLIKARAARPGEKSLAGVAEDWIMEYPYSGEGASSDKISAFLQGIEHIFAIDFAYDATSLDTYGLGDDKIILSVSTYDSKTSKLYIGKSTANGVYVQKENSPEVYIADNSIAQIISGVDVLNMVSKHVRIHNISDVKSIEISKDGKIATLSIDQSKKDEDSNKFKINGKSTSAKAFKKEYQNAIGVFFVDYTDAAVSNPFMRITYNLTNGTADTLKFYEYNERYYIVKRASGQGLTVLKTTLNELFNLLT